MSDIKELRERYQLTRQQFSDLFCIPLRTVQSWELGDRSCPLYVFLMMETLLNFYDLHGELAAFRKAYPETPDRCVCCGEIIPEGRQVCPICVKKGDSNGNNS